jgi:hypothetical protein
MFVSRHGYLFAAICAVAWLMASVRVLVAGDAFSVDADRVAIQGYDTVAYFTESKPVKGSPEFEAVWQGVRWRFANAEHRDMFSAKPENYAPRFGGYCVMGMTMGLTEKPDPEAWAIVDDKLYLASYKQDFYDLNKDLAGNIHKAEAAWKARGN